jgi:hypothetical protein
MFRISTAGISRRIPQKELKKHAQEGSKGN